MKRIISGAVMGLTCVLIAGCADGGYGRGGGSISYYDGYYDGSYGPFYDGYWANDGAFYYSGGEGRPFVRDDHQHFRHDRAAGFQHVRGRGWSRGGAPSGGHAMGGGNSATHMTSEHAH